MHAQPVDQHDGTFGRLRGFTVERQDVGALWSCEPHCIAHDNLRHDLARPAFFAGFVGGGRGRRAAGCEQCEGEEGKKVHCGGVRSTFTLTVKRIKGKRQKTTFLVGLLEVVWANRAGWWHDHSDNLGLTC